MTRKTADMRKSASPSTSQIAVALKVGSAGVMTVAAPTSRPLFGAAMIIGGMVLIGFIDNFVQVFADFAGLWQFHSLRSAIAIPTIFAVAWLAGFRLKPANWGGAMLRTVLIAASMLLYFGSLPMAPIAQVGAGIFTSPIWVLVFSTLLFRTPIGPRRILAVAIGFSGAMLILRPWEAGFTIWSVVPIVAGALYALAMIATRRYCADEPTLGLNLLFFAVLGGAGAAGAGVLHLAPQPDLAAEAGFFFQAWVWPLPATAWALLALQAFGSIIAVLMLTRGYQSAETSLVIPFEYTFLISASVTAWAIFGERVDQTTLIGMALIVGAGLFIATRPAPEG